MKIMERHISRVRAGQWATVESVEKQYDAIEQPWSFPPKRRYRALYGGQSREFYVTEREWEGMANREAALGSAFGSPEWLALAQELDQAIESLQIEIFQVLD